MKIFQLFLLLNAFLVQNLIAQQALPLEKHQLKTDTSVRYDSFVSLYKAHTDLSYTSPVGEIGSPVRYIIVGRLTTSYFLLADEKLPIAFALVPDFTVKVNDDRSSGVRTPSLKLGGVAYIKLKSSNVYYRYASLRFTHHSNGQDGDALNENGIINTTNGNFSTNYLTASYHFGKQKEGDANHFGQRVHHEIGFEWHKWFSYEAALEDDYGFSRLIYNFSIQHQYQYRNADQWRLYAGINYAVNKIEAYPLQALKKRLNSEVSFHYAFPFMSKAFLMVAAGYYGEDPYNIYYRNKYTYMRFGVSAAL